MTVLRTHRKHQLEDRLLVGGARQDTGLVFTTAIGTAINPSNLRRLFDALTESAGLGHWTPNELRHSAASLLSAAGVPLEVIADILGHASTRMLEQHYRHQVKPSMDAHVAVMGQMFGGRAAQDPVDGRRPLSALRPGRSVSGLTPGVGGLIRGPGRS